MIPLDISFSIFGIDIFLGFLDFFAVAFFFSFIFLYYYYFYLFIYFDLPESAYVRLVHFFVHHLRSVGGGEKLMVMHVREKKKRYQQKKKKKNYRFICLFVFFLSFFLRRPNFSFLRLLPFSLPLFSFSFQLLIIPVQNLRYSAGWMRWVCHIRSTGGQGEK